MRSRSIRVVCYSPYPACGPSARHRIYGYARLWDSQSISLTVLPFMTERFYRMRRCFGPLATIEKSFWFAFCSLRLLVRLPRAYSADVVLIHREAFPLGRPWFERLLAWINPALVFDFDDAIWERPSNAVNQRSAFWDCDRVPAILRLSREVVVGSPYLRDYATAFAGRVTVVPTPFDDLGGADRPARATIPVVVWIGNIGNAWYVSRILPALERVAASVPFQLRLIGGADIEEVRSSVLAIERRPWSETEERSLTEADIGIMPVPDLGYERGKGGFKIVQYWSSGLAVVASPVGINTVLIQNGENGLLAGDDDWEPALTRLLADPVWRRQIAAAGRNSFLTHHTRDVCAQAWTDVLHRVSAA